MILYFSATGNSKYVAERLAAELADEATDIFTLIRNGDFSELHSKRPWVVAAPTYAWQLPRIVRDWLRRAKLTGSKQFYFTLTCGSSIGGAGRHAKRLCEEMGAQYMGCAQIVMPENYVAMFPVPEEDEARSIVTKAEPDILSLAERIKRGEPEPGHSGALGGVLYSAVNRFFFHFLVKDRKFTVSDACISCGKCADICPLKNIEMKSGRPLWNGNCTHCMACICGCPAAAIEYGRASVGKPRYRCPAVK